MEYLTPEDIEVAKANGIDYNNVYQRYYIRGWSKEKTLNDPIKYRKPQWKLYQALAESNGICEGTFYSRVRKMSPEEAATKPLDVKQSKRRRDYEATRA